MATITFDGAQRWYPGADGPAVPGLDLEVGDGEFLVLVGPSGCGKSTTLRMLAGLETVDAGRIRIGERDVTRLPPKSRDIAMVFQNYALYPHMTVAENMGFALKMAKMPRAERDARVADAARILGLTDYLGRKPKALSGGQRQRVAMGRAIVRQPQVFCMDEPLSNLDAKMRVQTRTDIARLQRELGVTTVYVTHDQVEAMTMGDRVAVMKDGEIQQVDTPLRLYERPANSFVAGFIGSPQMNLMAGHAEIGGVRVGRYAVPTAAALPSSVLGDVVVGVRPESWRLVGSGEGGLPVEVGVVENLGADSYLYGRSTIEGAVQDVVIRVEGHGRAAPGDTVHVTTDPAHVHVFDAVSGRRIDREAPASEAAATV
ncbi:sn-glycerol-3-phosphate ABC transporter ATP-binding protein UgpC [Nocardioides carbamazepini]|uniref:ABC transporter ATP-binding protein n=1 Tax=Nocardioides carbamazepini TaxID=2854259 RepID=UPI00214A2932|nr:sn-glycerol-3-phosphate ABC transporter ATP-binding protein UgpC [Nocardioides carbamazepini]MCR1782353.1 sn-glycerol-3-phosphate ABC transporter ATP-binding protein UgpC [Nocardioides carbamazepini]